MIPGLAPALRVTVWGARPILFDFGLTVFQEDDDRWYGGDSQFLLEFGMSFDVADRAKRLRPYRPVRGA